MLITISRQFGSGGHLIAQQLAARRKMRYLDREIVEAVAKRLQAPMDVVAARDESTESWSERIQNALASLPDPLLYQAPPTNAARITEEMTHKVTQDVLREAARIGNAVIVGRGAQVLFAGQENTFHFLVYARHEVRLRRIAERLDLATRDAARLLEEVDARRTEYLRLFYGRDVYDPQLYDLMVSTTKTGIPAAVDIMECWLERFAR